MFRCTTGMVMSSLCFLLMSSCWAGVALLKEVAERNEAQKFSATHVPTSFEVVGQLENPYICTVIRNCQCAEAPANASSCAASQQQHLTGPCNNGPSCCHETCQTCYNTCYSTCCSTCSREVCDSCA